MQVELGRCGGLASGAALVGGGWRWGNTEGRGAHAAARAAATGRHGGGGGAHAAARERRRESTEEAEVLVRRRGSGDTLGQWGVASSDRGARTRAGRPVGHGASLWRGATEVPPRAANPGAPRGGLATDRRPPHVSEFQISEKPEDFLPHKKNRYKVRKNLGKLIIATSSKSSPILNYSKNSKSNLV
jgi:hypothetical protein